MNMMVIACGDTAILVDAGVMFPEPELLGVDLIIPDFRPLERYTIAGAGADARARGPHRRGAARAAARQGPDLRHAADAGPGRDEARGARRGGQGTRLVRVKPRERVTVGAFTSSSCASRTACRTAWRWRSTRRAAWSCTRATSRSIRRRSTASTSTSTASRSSAPTACSCCSATARTSSARVQRLGARRHRRLRGDLHQRAREDRRRDVRVEPLPDADPRRPGRSVRSQGGVRRPRRDRELADRAAARLPADSGRRADPRQRPARPTRRRTSSASAPGRRASRRRRCRGSPSTTTGTPSSTEDDVVVFSAREIPGQREGDRPGDEPHRAARRRHRPRGNEARPRVGTRQRGRAEAHAFAGQAAVLRADTRGVPPAGPPRAGGGAGVPRHEGGAGRERRPHPYRRRGRAGRREGAGRPDPDRRHAQRRGRRRGAARPAPPGRGRAGRAGRGDQPAVRRRSRRRRT